MDEVEKSELIQDLIYYGVKNEQDAHRILERFKDNKLMIAPRQEGKYRGSKIYWPRSHQTLLRLLYLVDTSPGAHQVAACCNVPVWLWLFRNQEYGISIEQIRVVMQKWAMKEKRSSESGIKKDAIDMFEEFERKKGYKRYGIGELEKWVKKIRGKEPLNSEWEINPIESVINLLDYGYKRSSGLHEDFNPANAGTIWYLYEESLNRLSQANRLSEDHCWLWARHLLLYQSQGGRLVCDAMTACQDLAIMLSSLSLRLEEKSKVRKIFPYPASPFTIFQDWKECVEDVELVCDGIKLERLVNMCKATFAFVEKIFVKKEFFLYLKKQRPDLYLQQDADGKCFILSHLYDVSTTYPNFFLQKMS